MSKKPKITIRPLADRIAKARKEGRTQQALELARTLAKHEPCEAHRELLRQVTLERGEQLLANGLNRDAGTVFQNALTMGGTPEFLANVAQRLAACGAIGSAMQAIEQIPDPAVRQRVLQGAVDAALTQGPTGKNALPADLHAAFDLTLQAFAHYEAGRDDEARAALQGIGLQSPFLEWKVFLRGLLAYNTNDDTRALENWSRLDLARLPARLAAPLRAAIDPAFLGSQPAAVQQTLRTKLMQQQGLSIAPFLIDIKEMLNDEDLAPAFRKAEQVVAFVRRDHPDVLPRLAQCFFWAVIEQGQPDDITRYLRLFGPPTDDPKLHRLEALALESRGLWSEAHKAWLDFIDQVAKNPTVWPGESSKRVQALIWMRMAENAAFKYHERKRTGNPFFDLFGARPAALKPGPEQCLENAIKLAPDRLDGYRALFELYRAQDKIPKAKKVGQQLLKQFPDHAATMEALGKLYMDTKDYKKAQEHFEKAIQANPLEQSLRAFLARAKRNYALELTLAGKFDKAREQFEQTMPLVDRTKISVLCQWAVAELKANNLVRAEELIAQANAAPHHRLACRFALVGESVRAKLSAKQKKQIADDLKTAFANAPTPAEILILVESAAHQRTMHNETFHGQKAQEKTILKFLEEIKFSTFDEKQLMGLCDYLKVLQARKPWLKCLTHARRHFLKNPFFRLSYADFYLMEETHDPKTHLAREHLDDARRLVQEMPRGEEQQQFFEVIKHREELIAELDARTSSPFDAMGGMFGGFSPFGDEDDDDFFGGEGDDDW